VDFAKNKFRISPGKIDFAEEAEDKRSTATMIRIQARGERALIYP